MSNRQRRKPTTHAALNPWQILSYGWDLHPLIIPADLRSAHSRQESSPSNGSKRPPFCRRSGKHQRTDTVQKHTQASLIPRQLQVILISHSDAKILDSYQLRVRVQRRWTVFSWQPVNVTHTDWWLLTCFCVLKKWRFSAPLRLRGWKDASKDGRFCPWSVAEAEVLTAGEQQQGRALLLPLPHTFEQLGTRHVQGCFLKSDSRY